MSAGVVALLVPIAILVAGIILSNLESLALLAMRPWPFRWGPILATLVSDQPAPFTLPIGTRSTGDHVVVVRTSEACALFRPRLRLRGVGLGYTGRVNSSGSHASITIRAPLNQAILLGAWCLLLMASSVLAAFDDNFAGAAVLLAFAFAPMAYAVLLFRGPIRSAALMGSEEALALLRQGATN